MTTTRTTTGPDQTMRSSVRLNGRLTALPVERELPSGDVLVTFRLSVPRQPTPLGLGSRQTSDWVDCVTAAGRVRRAAATWSVGDEVTVEGVLRRRFLRGGSGPGGSRLEVEALRARRVRRVTEPAANAGDGSPRVPSRRTAGGRVKRRAGRA